MSRLPWLLVAALISLACFLVACGSSEGSPDPSPVGDEGSESAERQPEATPTQREDLTFDISNRDEAAARLSYLYEILAGANPISDPISWAKGGIAAIRIDEICNNFDISEDLDPACDQLLLALETPFNQIGPILSRAATELRSILPRRKLAEYGDLVREWDGDITGWQFTPEMRGALSQLKDSMERCKLSESGCVFSPAGFLDFIGLRLSLLAEDPTISDLITLSATSDLFDDLSEYRDEDSLYGRQLDASRIVDELEDLGIY